MRVVLCGKNTAATECLEHLVERGDEVWALGVAGDDGADGWQRSFRRRAEALGVRFEQPRRINAPETIERLAAFAPDVLVSIQYDQILKGPLFRTIGCACLNLHFALLPRHRGVAPIAWAVMQGDAEAGVTLHHMVEDIDAGDVVAQRRVPIAPDDGARQVYEKVSAATVALFRESHPFPASLLGRRLPQDASVASYHRAGDFDFSRRAVDWTRPAAELQRWLRAMIFPPMQHPETTLGGRRLEIRRVGGVLGPVADVAPGTVVSAGADGIVVAAADGSVVVQEMVAADGAPARVAAGERFTPPAARST
jgi:methionyl-tRNA formyltransferase